MFWSKKHSKNLLNETNYISLSLIIHAFFLFFKPVLQKKLANRTRTGPAIQLLLKYYLAIKK